MFLSFRIKIKIINKIIMSDEEIREIEERMVEEEEEVKEQEEAEEGEKQDEGNTKLGQSANIYFLNSKFHTILPS